MAAPTLCGSNIPVLNGCPNDDAQILIFNVSSMPDGVALLTWGAARCCWVSQIFGAGIVNFTGGDLDGQGRYFNGRFTQSLQIFANNIQQFLNSSQWMYLLDTDGKVIGVQILIGYIASDNFFVFPNPTCSDLVPPDEELSGLNETIYGTGVDIYELLVTDARRLRFGNELAIQVYIDNAGDGNYSLQTVPIVPDVSPNPTRYFIGGLGFLNFKLIIT